MSDELDNTQTKKNLETALQGEALAHLKYQFYRSKLVDFNKGYEIILDEIIHNEKEHGKIWFKKLHGGTVPDNELNLLDAIEGETYEYRKMYTSFGDVATEEGFTEIAELFYQIAEIEGRHSEVFSGILNEIKNEEKYYESLDICKWKCLNCGHIVIGKEAPKECPICNHPQKYFVKL